MREKQQATVPQNAQNYKPILTKFEIGESGSEFFIQRLSLEALTS